LLGEYKGEYCSKFLLRIAAICLGVPEELALRKKIPFNEGGTGVRNDGKDDRELIAAKNTTQFDEVFSLAQKELVSFKQLGVCRVENSSLEEQCIDYFSRFSLFFCAQRAGLKRLILGKVFRNEMPDCIYSTSELDSEHVFEQLIRLSSVNFEFIKENTQISENINFEFNGSN